MNRDGTYLRRLVGPWVPHEPTERQQVALEYLPPETEAKQSDILYGGAAGGGKSDWLLMEALRYAEVPGYSALLVRRTHPQLTQPGGLIPRSHEWLAGTAARWNEVKSTWTFPSGATLRLASMQHEKDRYQYQGAELQMVGFDELTHFSERQFRYLFSRLRRPNDGTRKLSELPLRMRSASNPGGEGHDWVRQRYLIEDAPGRVFIPARLQDNPYLDAAAYIENLAELFDDEREQLLEGNWDSVPLGAVFQAEWFETVSVPPAMPMQRVRSWDIAATAPKPGTDPDYTVGVLMSRAHDVGERQQVYIEDVARGQWGPEGVDAAMLGCAARDGIETTIVIEDQPAAAGKFVREHFRDVLAGYDVRFESPSGSKAVRARPFASYAANGGVRLVEGPWVGDWVREHVRFTGTAQDSHDDQVDASSQGFARLHLKPGLSPEDLYGTGRAA